MVNSWWKSYSIEQKITKSINRKGRGFAGASTYVDIKNVDDKYIKKAKRLLEKQ